MILKSVVTLQVYYYIPDYENIVQEFLWQTQDIVPEIPRVHKFLNFWKDNIDATIKDINVAWNNNSNFDYLKLKNLYKLQ